MKAIRCSKCHNDNYSDGNYCIFCGANLYSTYSRGNKSSENTKTKKSIFKKLGRFLLRLTVLLISLVPGCIISVWSIMQRIEYSGHGGDFQYFLIYLDLITVCIGIPLIIAAIVGWRVPYVSGPFFTVVALSVAGYELSAYGHLQGHAMQLVLLFLAAGLLNIIVWLTDNKQKTTQIFTKWGTFTLSIPGKCRSFAHTIADKCAYVAHEI